jgi:hypothetical protein
MKPSHSSSISFAIPLLVICLLGGCGGAGNDGLVGTWEIDQEAMSEALSEQMSNARDPMQIGRSRMAMGMIDAMRWTASLSDDGALLLTIEEPGHTLDTDGTWSASDGAVTLTYADERDRTQTLTGTLQGRRIHLEPENEGQPGIILKRTGAAAVVAAPEPPPPMGPLRQDCPPRLASAPRRDGAPVDDILGLRPGLAYNDVVALLECRDDIRVIQTSALWNVEENFGIPTRQLVRASDGIPCTERQAARRDACDTGGGRFEPLRDSHREYIVAFTGMPGEEIARVIWRRNVYGVEDNQAISVLNQALVEKYGAPQLQVTGSHARINHTRPGATNLVWLFTREGAPQPPPASQFSNAATNWETCVNGPQPRFDTGHRWNSACNLTIRTEIMPQPDNGLLARELNMTVMNQRDLYHGGQQFQHALRAVSDERLRQQSATPDL